MERTSAAIVIALGAFGLMVTGVAEVAAQAGGFTNSGSNGFRSVGNGNMAAQREAVRLQADEIGIQQDIISTLQTSQNIGNINMINQYGDGTVEVHQDMSGDQSLLSSQNESARGMQSTIPGAER